MAKALIKAFATVSIFGIVTRVLSFLFKIFLSRKLGAELLGVYQITFSVFMLFIGLSASGITTTVSRKTAENEALFNHDKSSAIFVASLLLSVGASLAITLFFVLFPNILSLLFADKRCIELFIILLPSLFSTAVYCTTRAWFWGKKQYGLYSGAELFEELVKIVVTTTLITLPLTSGNLSKAVASAYVIGDYLAAAVIIVMFMLKGGKIKRPRHFKEVAKSAVPLTGTRVFGSMLSSAAALLLPIFLIKNGLTTTEATAEFGRMSGMAMPMLLAPTTVIGSLAVVIVPELASDSKNNLSVNKQIARGYSFASYIVAIFLALFIACGDELGELLYNDLRSGTFIALSAALMIPLSFSQLSSTILNSLGKENWTFGVHIVSAVPLMLSIVFLPAVIGIMAYPVGLFLFHTTGFVLDTYKLKKTTGIKLNYLFKASLVMLASVVAGVATRLLKNTYSVGLVLELIITSVIAMILLLIPLIPIIIKDIKALKKKMQ